MQASTDAERKTVIEYARQNGYVITIKQIDDETSEICIDESKDSSEDYSTNQTTGI